MRRFFPFAALLGVAIVLGCQDTGTGVVASDGAGPQFHSAHDDCVAHNKNNQGCPGGNGDDVVDPGTLLSRPNGKDLPLGYTCTGGAAFSAVADDNTSFGKVNWNQPRDDSHTHANVTLRGVDPGVYLIFGNHDRVCGAIEPNRTPNTAPFDFPVFDFPLRPGHATKVTVGANGKGKARIGLTYVTETPITIDGGTENEIPGFDFTVEDLSAMHAGGEHSLWLTVTGPLDVNGELPDNPVLVLRSVAVVVNIPVHD